MAWNFDRVAQNGSFTNTADGNRMLAGDGKMVWALMLPLTGTASHDIWCYDAVATHMGFSADGSNLAGTESSAPMPACRHQAVGSVATIAADGDTCYAALSDASFSLEATYFDNIQVLYSWGTKGVLIKAPVRMNSNLVIDNGKLWMSSYDINQSGQQTLYVYDLTSKAWSSTPIPTRHQTQPRFLARDHFGHILVCDYNSLSVTKFSNAGAFISTTRLAASAAGANRQPNFITISDDRSIYIASFQGMISKFDSTTDTVTSYSNGLGDVHSFVDDGTYLWVASEKRPSSVSYNGENWTCYKSHMSLGTFDQMMWQQGGDGAAGAWAASNYYVDDKEDVIRITKSNQQIRHFTSEDRDIAIESPSSVALGGVKVNSVLMTPSFVCSTKDGNITVPKYIWAITENNHLVAFPNTSMWRPNFYQMNGVAMMSFGQYDYIGE